jgi:phosphoesterase RecJ-like protein
LDSPGSIFDIAAVRFCLSLFLVSQPLYNGVLAIPALEGSFMPLDWTPLLALVHQHHRFLLTTHIRPDADGLGSQLALADALGQLGKESRLVIASTWPPRYDFLDPEKRIERFGTPGDRWRDTDAVIVLDTGTWGQLGDFGPFLRELPVPRVVIDHHLSQDDLGALRLVDTTAEATGRLVFEAVRALGVPLTPAMANRLFAAVAMDTGWFRHANTAPATFWLAADLQAAGAKPTDLYEQLFEQSTLPRLKLMGLVLDRLQVLHGGRVAFTVLYRDDYAHTGALPQDTEDLVNFTRSLAGVEVGLFFMEQPRGGVKVSFRSRTLDVASVAERFGGGGHRLAAGATLALPLDEAQARVLEAIAAALG